MGQKGRGKCRSLQMEHFLLLNMKFATFQSMVLLVKFLPSATVGRGRVEHAWLGGCMAGGHVW